jgi:hypothetical protein
MDKRDSTPPSPSSAATGAAAAPAQTGTGPIAPTSPDYPPYYIAFNGASLTGPLPVTGPHTFLLTPPPGGGQLRVTLSRNAADPGRPNLSITFGEP